MLTLSNQGCSLIKIDSDLFASMLGDISSYANILITSSINCCPTSYTNTLLLTNTSACTTCIGVNMWSIDMNLLATAGFDITGVYLKNLVTGQVYNTLSVPIDWAYYAANCIPLNCLISAVGPGHYDNLFRIAINSYLTTNMFWTTVTVGFCGNKLTICNLPANIVLSHITYDDGSTLGGVQLFKYNDINSASFISGNSIYINPTLFSASTFADGVYKITVRLNKTDGSYIEQNSCFFLDCVSKCKVATAIDNYIENTTDKSIASSFNNLHMIHYALTNDGNCGCNCNDLCDLYKYFTSQLDNTIPCGC